MQAGWMAGQASIMVGVALLVALAMPDKAAAQTADRGFFVGAGIGLGLGEMTVGSESGSGSGLMVHGQIGTARAGSRRWTLDVSGMLFDVSSPVADERYRAISLMLHRSFWSPVSLSPGIGVEHRAWSGPQRVEASDAGLIIGISMERSVRIGDNLMFLPELAWQRSFIELEGSVTGDLLSMRVSVLRMGS